MTSPEKSTYPDIVGKFVKMRTLDPNGTEDPFSKVHRNDIYKLDGRDGQRALTWHDQGHGVVWMLGFTANHDLTALEDRANRAETREQGGTNQLMPSVADYSDLADDRRNADTYEKLEGAIAALYRKALDRPGEAVRGTLASAVRCEILVDTGDPVTVHARFRMPPVLAGAWQPAYAYSLAGSLPGADPATIEVEPMPPGVPPARGAVSLIILADR